MKSPTLLCALAALATSSQGGVPEPFSHDDWATVLTQSVDDSGRVDYDGLAADRQVLDRYLDGIRRVGPETHPAQFPDPKHELAYYINAYNALVFEGVLARGLERESVWKGGLISGYGFFVGRKISIEGRRTNLKKLEDKTIRKSYEDPRIHAALNCASIGCPRLQRDPFTGEKLDEQLDAAMREFVNDERHVRVDSAAGVIYLSKIFDWFRKDFTGHMDGGSSDADLIGYINQFRDDAAQIAASSKVKYLKYDKRINSRP
jgi:hypothetical protein